jgi:hypothetical protein
VSPTLANLITQIFGKPNLSASEYEGMSAGSFVQFAERAIDLRLVFNETYIMGCTLGPISRPHAEVALQLHPFIIHPSTIVILDLNLYFYSILFYFEFLF